MERTPQIRKVATAAVITAIARTTAACERHGQIECVRPREGRVTERGHSLSVMLFDVTFSNGQQRTYWMRADVPTEVKA